MPLPDLPDDQRAELVRLVRDAIARRALSFVVPNEAAQEPPCVARSDG